MQLTILDKPAAHIWHPLSLGDSWSCRITFKFKVRGKPEDADDEERDEESGDGECSDHADF